MTDSQLMLVIVVTTPICQLIGMWLAFVIFDNGGICEIVAAIYRKLKDANETL